MKVPESIDELIQEIRGGHGQTMAVASTGEVVPAGNPAPTPPAPDPNPGTADTPTRVKDVTWATEPNSAALLARRTPGTSRSQLTR